MGSTSILCLPFIIGLKYYKLNASEVFCLNMLYVQLFYIHEYTLNVDKIFR